MSEETVMTNMTAMPMPNADSTFLETPRKGQIPRNCTNIRLFTKTAPIINAPIAISCLLSALFGCASVLMQGVLVLRPVVCGVVNHVEY